MTQYIADLISRERSSGEGNLISFLLGLPDDALRGEELHAQCAMLFFAGHETTRNLIGNGIFSLLSHVDEMRRLLADPRLYSSAIDEIARFDSPVQVGTRISASPIEAYGQRIPEGSLLLYLFGAANRDWREFADPDRLDVSRRPNRHVSFGSGPHVCAGAHLARIETEIAVRAVFSRLPGIELCGTVPEWVDNFGFRGLRTLMVAFKPTMPSGMAALRRIAPYEHASRNLLN
jgi:cytochrome P450